MIIKNEIPILEYDDSSSEVITPNQDCEIFLKGIDYSYYYEEVDDE